MPDPKSLPKSLLLPGSSIKTMPTILTHGQVLEIKSQQIVEDLEGAVEYFREIAADSDPNAKVDRYVNVAGYYSHSGSSSGKGRSTSSSVVRLKGRQLRRMGLKFLGIAFHAIRRRMSSQKGRLRPTSQDPGNSKITTIRDQGGYSVCLHLLRGYFSTS